MRFSTFVLLPAVSLFALSASNSFAQKPGPEDSTPKAEKKEWIEPEWKHLSKEYQPDKVDAAVFGKIYKHWQKARRITGTVGFNMRGDDAGAKTQFRLGASLDIRESSFPREFRFLVASDVTWKDKKLQEDLTRLLANYDYNFYRFLEGYAFMERISDSYMSIDKRYEVGFGLKIHGAWNQRDQSIRGFGDTLAGLKDGADEKLLADLNRVENAYLGLKQANARWDVGIAFSLFWEQEFSRIETRTSIREDTVITVDVPVEQNWRGVIRPSIRWAPTDEFTIDAKTYIKYKLESSGDRRVDTMVEAKIGVKEAETYRAIVRVAFMQRFDSDPPAIPIPPNSEIEYYPSSAEKKHDIFLVEIQVKWS